MINKKIVKTLRLTETEYNIIKEKIDSLGINFSDFSRQLMLDKKIKPSKYLDLVNQVARIGNNLNQIARKINTEKEIKNEVELLEELKKINDKLNLILEK
jgi:uncharacterized membrane protein